MNDTSLERNIARVREKIALTAKSAGRAPEDITLVAASKTRSAETVARAVAAGITVCGENRVQEMLEKLEKNAYAGAKLHFIGHLQKNKARLVVGRCALIESVDGPELLELISRRALELDICQELLIEINIAAEETKSGIAPEKLPEILETASRLPGIRVRGLMAIPPPALGIGGNRGAFAQMYKLFVDNSPKKYDNVTMDFLSMGMSGDFEDAIAQGANMVRVGALIFGERDYSRALPIQD